LLTNEFTPAVCKTQAGEIILGTTLGLTAFDPHSVHTFATPPTVVLTSLKVVDVPFGLGKVASGEPLNLKYDQNFLWFEFVALDFNNPTRNQFAFKLDGVDPDWVFSGNRHFANYTKLEHGEYTFKVKGANSDGVWGEETAALQVSIAPPFWKTWWFRVLVAVFAVSLVATAYEYRLSKIQEVEQMRKQIAEDLHDEIGSNLGTIALLSDMMARGKAERESKDISDIGAIARRTAEAMRDIIWVLKFNREQVADLALKMRDTAAEMLRDVRYSFEMKNGEFEQVRDMRFQRNVMLIYREALHNIIKYAHASEVSISLEQSNGALSLHIKDNGVGFDEATIERGNGLKNMRDRATRIGGKLEITSKPGKGTTLNLTGRIP
jgi:signal transduction histidine kinase